MSQKVVDRIVELTRSGQIAWSGERTGSYNNSTLISLEYTNSGPRWSVTNEWYAIVQDERVQITEVQFNEIKNAIKRVEIASESARLDKIMGYLS